MHKWGVPLCLDSYRLAHVLRGLDAATRADVPLVARFRARPSWLFGSLAIVAVIMLLTWPW